MEVDPQLVQLTMSKQTGIAILYLDHLTNGHTLLGMQVRLSTIKEYMNIIAKWVETYVGWDIGYHPSATSPDAPMSRWKHHSMFNTIYADIKSWQGVANRQDLVTKSIINYLQTLVVGKNPHSLTCALINFSVLACQTNWIGIEWLQLVNPHRSNKLPFFEYDNTTSKFANIIYTCCAKDFTFKRQCWKIIKDPFSIPMLGVNQFSI